jgi:NAD(P)-dependent dehydrogenase (short-subunit alcohol dehydrogenase family)
LRGSGVTSVQRGQGALRFPQCRKPDRLSTRAAGEIQELAAREALSPHPLEIDVTDEASVERAVNEVTAKCWRVDVLVNNAGYGIIDLVESVTLEEAQRQFDTNFFGVLRMNRAVRWQTSTSLLSGVTQCVDPAIQRAHQ